MEVIALPSGQLGLELEPASIRGINSNEMNSKRASSSSSGSSIGCKVRDWKADPHGLSSTLPPGAMIMSVDGAAVADLPFKDIIALLGSSTSRRVEFYRKPSKTSIAHKGEGVIASYDKENLHSNKMDSKGLELDPKGRPSFKVLAPNDLTAGPRAGLRDRSADGKMHVLNARLRVQAEELQTLHSDVAQLTSNLANKDEEVKVLEERVQTLKHEGRSNEGKFALAMFKLRKRLTAEAVALNKECGDTYTSEEFRSLTSYRIVHAGKMLNVMSELNQLHGRGDNRISTAIKTEEDELSLSKQLEVQKRLNERLTAQMHAWVDAQIALQCSLAEEEVVKAESTQAPVAGVKTCEDNERTNGFNKHWSHSEVKYSPFTAYGIGSKSIAKSPCATDASFASDATPLSVKSASKTSALGATPIEEKLLRPSISSVRRDAQSSTPPASAMTTISHKVSKKTPGSTVRFALHADTASPPATEGKRELAGILRGLCNYGTPAVHTMASRDVCSDSAISNTEDTRAEFTPSTVIASKPVVPLTAYRLSPPTGVSSSAQYSTNSNTSMEVSMAYSEDMTSESISIHYLSTCDREDAVARPQWPQWPQSHKNPIIENKLYSSFRHFPSAAESPSIIAMRSRVDKLRGEHESIRNDLLKFRSIIQHVKSEVHETLSYSI